MSARLRAKQSWIGPLGLAFVAAGVFVAGDVALESARTTKVEVLLGGILAVAALLALRALLALARHLRWRRTRCEVVSPSARVNELVDVRVTFPRAVSPATPVLVRLTCFATRKETDSLGRQRKQTRITWQDTVHVAPSAWIDGDDPRCFEVCLWPGTQSPNATNARVRWELELSSKSSGPNLAALFDLAVEDAPANSTEGPVEPDRSVDEWAALVERTDVGATTGADLLERTRLLPDPDASGIAIDLPRPTNPATAVDIALWLAGSLAMLGAAFALDDPWYLLAALCVAALMLVLALVWELTTRARLEISANYMTWRRVRFGRERSHKVELSTIERIRSHSTGQVRRHFFWGLTLCCSNERNIKLPLHLPDRRSAGALTQVLMRNIDGFNAP